MNDYEMRSTLTIKGRELEIVRKQVSVHDLFFNPDNPRIYSEMNVPGIVPDQEEIQRVMLTKEHVKVLINSIRVNGGVTDPLIVRGVDYHVVEGNSRLAACRALYEKFPEKFGYVKCDIIESDITPDEEFLLLAQFHIEGKKNWEPYEIAGLVWRRYQQGVDKKRIKEELLHHVSSVAKITQMIETYQMMVDHNIREKNKWSYFDEYTKSMHIKKVRKKYPELDEIFIKKLNTGEIEKAIDVREKISVITKSGQKNISDFIQEKDDLEGCYNKALESGVDTDIIKKVSSFKNYIILNQRIEEVGRLTDSQRKKLHYEINKVIKGSEKIREKIECIEKA